ncbi:MAG: TIM barrel protein [Candidatus Latescibacteria bacterium]|nr:TIM barrel protein [Candidatus Latescibacterota bacterium]
MRLLLNTIMLEVNRWSPDHQLSQPLSQLLPAVSRAGFDQLELWQYHISTLDQGQSEDLAHQLRTHGLRTPALGAYPSFHLEGAEDEQMQAQLDRVVATAQVLGVEIFKIFPGRLASAEADAAQWARSVRRIGHLAQQLERHGMRLTMETHGNTLCDSLASTQRLLGELQGGQHIGLCFQPYTAHDTDQALATFDALAPAIHHIHLQNRRLQDRSTTRLADGDWTDYRRFLPHVKASGFDGLLCLEFTAGLFPPEGQPFDPQTVLDHAVHDRRFVEATWDL